MIILRYIFLVFTLASVFVISRAVESDSHQEVNSLLTEETCYDNWIEYGDYCFKAYSRVYEEKLNWYGARSFCRGMGADLASFHSQAEEQQVIQQTNKYYETYWYGLNDIDQEGTYQWSDGSTVTYTNWVYGSPPYDYDGTSDCVSYYWQTYNSYYNGWDTQNCDLAKNSWVCKVAKGVELTTPTPPPPPNYCHEDNTGTDWLEYNGMCYYYSDLSGTDESSWTEAREFCNSQGGELASIHSDNETDWMSAQIRSSSTNHHWIGLREYGIGSGYEWSDGTALDYQNWDAGEPNDFNGEEQCVNFYAHDQGTWNDKNCGERIPFICRKFEHITHPITRIPTTPMPGPCPGGGWMEYGGKCYKIYSGDGSDSLTWEDARTVCRDLGGDLATIHSQALQSFLISKLRYVSSALWIGLSDISYQNRFIWTDGTPVDYTNWAADEPNGYYADDCVEMMYISSHAGQWNDISCDSERGYICQGDKDVDPSAPDPTYPSEDECQDDYIQEYLGCYKVVKSSQTHQSSNDICVNDGGNLVSIIDAYEQGFIDTLVFDVDRPLWIGMAYNEESSEYKWIDGTPVYYTNWGSGEPSGGDDSGCVQSTTDGWDDTNCAELTGAICKIYLAPPPTTPEYVEGHCPATFVSYGSDCYYFGGVNDYKSFSDGQLECIRLGADLASIHHQQENDFVFAYLNSMDVYLGLTRTGNGWKWVDESVLQYTNWAVGEPSDSNGEEDCVVMLHNQGTWNDLVCSGYKGYVCKRPKDGDPVESSTITNNPGDPVMDDPDSNNSDVNVAGIILVCELIIVAIVGIAFLVRWFVKKQCYGGKQGEFMSGPAADFSNSMYEPSVNSTPSTIPSISAMSGSPVGPVYDNPQPVPQYPEDTIYFSVA